MEIKRLLSWRPRFGLASFWVFMLLVSALWAVFLGRDSWCLVAEWPAHDGKIVAACFSKDGEQVLTAGRDGNLFTWEEATGEKKIRFLRENFPQGGPFSYAFYSPDGHRIIAKREGGFLSNHETLFLDASSGLVQERIGSGIFDLDYSPNPDGNLQTISANDGYMGTGGTNFILIETLKTGEEVGRIRGGVLNFSPDGRQMVTLNEDRTALCVWGTETTQLVMQTELGTGIGELLDATFSPDNQCLLALSENGRFYMAEAPTRKELNTSEPLGAPKIREIACLSRDHRFVVGRDVDRSSLAIWDSIENRVVRTCSLPDEYIRPGSISSDSTRMLCNNSTKLFLIDLRTGNRLLDLTYWGMDVDLSLFSPTKEMILLGHSDGRVSVLRRRFPEWWWGHFYRPEVWVAILLSLVWTTRMALAMKAPNERSTDPLSCILALQK